MSLINAVWSLSTSTRLGLMLNAFMSAIASPLKHEKLYQSPLFVPTITCTATILALGDISPNHRNLQRIVEYLIDSQTTDVTQLVFGQTRSNIDCQNYIW